MVNQKESQIRKESGIIKELQNQEKNCKIKKKFAHHERNANHKRFTNEERSSLAIFIHCNSLFSLHK